MAKTNGAVNNLDILGGTPIVINATAAAYSESFVCPKNVTFGFEFLFGVGSTVDVDITIEQGNTAPATEGASDTNMVIPSTGSYLLNVADKLVKVDSHSPTVSNFMRFKFQGKGSNSADTQIDRCLINTIVNL